MDTQEDKSQLYQFRNGASCTKRADYTKFTHAEGKVGLTKIFEAQGSYEKKMENAKQLTPKFEELEAAFFDICYEYGEERLTPPAYQENRKVYDDIRRRYLEQGIAPAPVAPAPAIAPAAKILVVDRLVMNSTPQSGTWLYCFGASAANSTATYHIPHHEYSGDGVSIDMGLQLPAVPQGTRVAYSINLDDDEADACSASAEDKTSGTFVASATGSQQGADGAFRYILSWHLQ